MAIDPPRSSPATGRAPSGLTLPNMVIIGAQKCGTTSLHKYLDVHPEISMSSVKETDFFLPEGNWSRGFEWYASLCDPSSPVRGEASPNYTELPISSGLAERMHEHLPEAKLIYLVRDPIDRISSHYVHSVAWGGETRPFAEAVTAPDNIYVLKSSYATQLRPFVEQFGQERILVESQERLLAEREATLRRIFGFLGVDPDFTSPEFEREWERTEGKGTAYQTASRLASRGVRLPRALRWPAQRLLRAAPGSKIERPEPSPDVRAHLERRLKPEADDLRRLTGLEFGAWSV